MKDRLLSIGDHQLRDQGGEELLDEQIDEDQIEEELKKLEEEEDDNPCKDEPENLSEISTKNCQYPSKHRVIIPDVRKHPMDGFKAVFILHRHLIPDNQ